MAWATGRDFKFFFSFLFPLSRLFFFFFFLRERFRDFIIFHARRYDILFFLVSLTRSFNYYSSIKITLWNILYLFLYLF